MVCPKCGKEYSDKVWRVHKERCHAEVRKEEKEATAVTRAEVVEHVAENHSKAELIEIAEMAGIDIDKRWGKERIAEAINGDQR